MIPWLYCKYCRSETKESFRVFIVGLELVRTFGWHQDERAYFSWKEAWQLGLCSAKCKCSSSWASAQGSAVVLPERASKRGTCFLLDLAISRQQACYTAFYSLNIFVWVEEDGSPRVPGPCRRKQIGISTVVRQVRAQRGCIRRRLGSHAWWNFTSNDPWSPLLQPTEPHFCSCSTLFVELSIDILPRRQYLVLFLFYREFSLSIAGMASIKIPVYAVYKLEVKTRPVRMQGISSLKCIEFYCRGTITIIYSF